MQQSVNNDQHNLQPIQYYSGNFKPRALRPAKPQSYSGDLKGLLSGQRGTNQATLDNKLTVAATSIQQSYSTVGNFTLKVRTNVSTSAASESQYEAQQQKLLREIEQWKEFPIETDAFINSSVYKETKLHLQRNNRVVINRRIQKRCSSGAPHGKAVPQARPSLARTISPMPPSTAVPPIVSFQSLVHEAITKLEPHPKQPTEDLGYELAAQAAYHNSLQQLKAQLQARAQGLPTRQRGSKVQSAVQEEGSLQQVALVEPKPWIQFDPVILKQILDQVSSINEQVKHIMKESEKFRDEFKKDLSKQIMAVNAPFKILSEQEQMVAVDLLARKRYALLDPILCKLKFFDRFEQEIRIKLYQLMSYEHYEQGQTLFRQGDHGDKLYIIMKGSVEVVQILAGGVEVIVSSLYDGQYFGELSLMETRKSNDPMQQLNNVKIKSLEQMYREMYQSWDRAERQLLKKAIVEYEAREGPIPKPEPKKAEEEIIDPGLLQMQQRRTATIKAAEACHCLALSRQNFKDILLGVMQDQLDERINLLKETIILRDFHNFALVPLANQLVLEKYSLDDILVREGETTDKLFLIMSGTCYTSRSITATRDQKLSAYFRSTGQLRNFALRNQPFQHNPHKKPEVHAPLKSKPHSKLMDYFPLKRTTDNTLQYTKVIRYQTLQRGAFIFGRALCEEQVSKVTLTSESKELLVYTLSRDKLEYLPEFLVTHLLTEFNIVRQIDDDIDVNDEDFVNQKWDDVKSQLAVRSIFQQAQERQKQIFKRF